ncbi:hypothetical protein [Roseicitreum antarcticum]|uniref:Uncharacterized protein n=1 Tax=Roseicitreum antarcticum TaxID=564137 RepID=A0A1H2ZVB7_9RHOB|nr:hypothetical protein [Roseicitreum antarcticum]SDX21353.1 hypothetical protein SAMN04488238_10689 [Roseicitreum antarcticum]
MTGPSLRQHLEDAQSVACNLSGLLNAVAYLQGASECQHGQAALIYVAENMARDLNDRLDSLNIPTGEIQ